MTADEGFPDFDSFSRLLETITPRQTPHVLRYRQGASAADYGEPGPRAYVDPRGAWQAGSAAWTGSASASGGFNFTLPAAYSGSALVLVSAAATTPLATPVALQAWCDGAQVEVLWASLGAPLSRLWLHWLAYGPGAI